MSKKYVIGLNEGVACGVFVFGKKGEEVVSATIKIDELEELNVAYVNEHFGGLQDESYCKGYEDGKKRTGRGCKGCKWESKNGYDEPCKHCCNAYLDQYTPMPKDEICFGDEIVVNGERGVVVSHENEGTAPIWALLNGYRTPQIIDKNNYTKTGRRFDMAVIMEALNWESTSATTASFMKGENHEKIS